MERTVWKIRVSGYGTFEFDGTEQEAEEKRRRKAQWERGSAMKWRADLKNESDRLAEQMAVLWDNGEGVPKPLLMKRAKALRKERDTPTNA